MSKKVKHLTFAERATLIKKKYRNYDDDPIAMKSMDMELSELAKEQEQYKNSNEIEDVGYTEMKYGGRLKLAFGDPLPKKTAAVNALLNPEVNYEPVKELDDNFIGPLTEASLLDQQTLDSYIPKGDKKVGALNNYQLKNLDLDFTKDNDAFKKDLFYPDFDGINDNVGASSPATTPYDLMNEEETKVGYAGLLGALGSGIAALRKPRTTKFNRFTPTLIDDSVERKVAKDSINASYNNVAAQSNETAQSGAQRLGRSAAIEGSRANKISSVLSQIRERTDNTNAGISNNANQINTQIANEEVVANEQNFANVENSRLAFFDALGKSIAMREREKTQASIQDKQNRRLLTLINNGISNDYNVFGSGKITPRTGQVYTEEQLRQLGIIK
jgi:hypothetical protein